MDSIGIFIKRERIRQNLSQETLANGICSNTYLSKIENNSVVANEDIITLIVEALGHTYNDDTKSFTELNDMVWQKFILFEDFDFEIDDSVDKILDTLIFSKVGIDVVLLRALISVLKYEKLSDDYFEVIVDANLNMQRLHKHNIIKSIAASHLPIIDDNLVSFSDEWGIISYYQSLRLFINAKYYESIKFAKKAYRRFGERGNVMGLIKASEVESYCHANLNNIADHIKVSKRISNLNAFVKDGNVDYNLNYNLSSSYLSVENYELAEVSLIKCLENSEVENKDSAYEKLALLYLFTNRNKEAKEYIDLLNKRDFESLGLLNTLYAKNGNIKDSNYILELEKRYEKEKELHYGRSMLFGSLLYTAYKSTYQYPKALKLFESMSFSQSPLFLKK